MIRLIKNLIKSNPFKCVLIVISIALCVALFFSSQIVMDSIMKNFESYAGSTLGGVDVVFEDDLIDDAEIGQIKEFFAEDKNEFLYRNKLSVKTTTPEARVSLIGIDFERESAVFGYKVQNIASNDDFYLKRGVLIDKGDADRLGVVLGSTIQLNFDNKLVELTVRGILENVPTGEYLYGTTAVFVSAQYLTELLNPPQEVNTVLIASAFTADELQNTLQGYWDNYNLRTTTFESLAYWQQYLLDEVALILDIFKILLLFLGCFIIFTTYKIILSGRVRSSGLLRSVGLSKKKLFLTLSAEALFLGIFGSVLGVLLGGALAGAISKVLVAGYAMPTAAQISVLNFPALLSAFLIGGALPVVASAFSIFRFSNRKIVGMLRYNEVAETTAPAKRKIKIPKWLGLSVAAIILLIEILLIFLAPEVLAVSSLVTTIFLFLINIAALWLLIPYIIKLFNVTVNLGAKNRAGIGAAVLKSGGKKNASVVFITALCLITTLTVSSVIEMYHYSVNKNVNDLLKFDYVITNDVSQNGFTAEQTAGLAGLGDKIEYQYAFATVLNNYGENVKVLAVDTDKFLQTFQDKIVDGDIAEAINKLKNPEHATFEDGSEEIFYRCVIMEDYAQDFLGVGYVFSGIIGNVQFEVAAIMENDAAFPNLIIVDYNAIQGAFPIIFQNTVLIRLNDYADSETAAKVEALFANGQYRITSNSSVKEDMLGVILDNEPLLELLNYLVLAIAILGLINLYYIKLKERKNNYLLFRCLGADKATLRKTMLLENMSSSVLGLLTAIPFSLLFIKIVSSTMQAMIPRYKVYFTVSWLDFVIHSAILIFAVFAYTLIAAQAFYRKGIVGQMKRGD